jgi:16S rRNA processing protein RimM
MSKINVDARLIGIIGKPHGIRGETNVMLLTDYPKTVKKGSVLFFDKKCQKKAEVESIRKKNIKKHLTLIIKFKGIDSRDQAEKLKSASIFRNIKDSPKLKKGQYWVDDIVDCRVYNKSEVFIGRVIDVEKFSSNDNLEVKIENIEFKIKGIDSGILYVPVIERYIDSINIKEKKVILKEIPEYV